MEYQGQFYITLSHTKRRLHTVCDLVYHIAIYTLTSTLAVTLHNLTFQAQVMGQARDSIMEGTFPTYLRKFFADYFRDVGYPEWCVNALRSVGVDLVEGYPEAKVVKGDGSKWEYSGVVPRDQIDPKQDQTTEATGAAPDF